MSKKRSTQAEAAARLDKIGSASYPIGYGKPPPASRWKKGQSGNPGGPKIGLTKALIVEGMEEAMQELVERRRSDGSIVLIPFHKALGLKYTQTTLAAANPGQFQQAIVTLDTLGILKDRPADQPADDQGQWEAIQAFAEEMGVPAERFQAYRAAHDGSGDQPDQAPQHLWRRFEVVI